MGLLNKVQDMQEKKQEPGLSVSDEPTLESRLLTLMHENQYVDLESALIVASGADDVDSFKDYKKKVSAIDRDFREKNPLLDNFSEPVKARKLYDFIKQDKGIYDMKKTKLTDVVDSFLEGDENIGNCLGLTSLYSVLAQRNGLRPAIMANKRHVFNFMLDHSSGDVYIIDLSARNDGFVGTSQDDVNYSMINNYLSENDFKMYVPEKLVPITYNNRASMESGDDKEIFTQLRKGIYSDEGMKLDVVKDSFNKVLKRLYESGNSYEDLLSSFHH